MLIFLCSPLPSTCVFFHFVLIWYFDWGFELFVIMCLSSVFYRVNPNLANEFWLFFELICFPTKLFFSISTFVNFHYTCRSRIGECIVLCLYLQHNCSSLTLQKGNLWREIFSIFLVVLWQTEGMLLCINISLTFILSELFDWVEKQVILFSIYFEPEPNGLANIFIGLHYY